MDIYVIENGGSTTTPISVEFFGEHCQILGTPTFLGNPGPPPAVTKNLDVAQALRTTGKLRASSIEIDPSRTTLADAWTVRSSARWKDKVRPISDALAKVQKLRGVYYNRKDTGKPEIGLIAEEVGTVIPEVVAFDDGGKVRDGPGLLSAHCRGHRSGKVTASPGQRGCTSKGRSNCGIGEAECFP